MEDARHPIHEELEVLRSMKSSQKMAEVILWGVAFSFFRDWIENENKQKL